MLASRKSTIVFDNLFDFYPPKNDISVYIIYNKSPPTQKGYETKTPYVWVWM
jgi:hypothetical protein